MSRIFKFRIWDIRLKTYLPTTDDLKLLKFQTDEYVIQQYTGLKDKHGKEIYEGDIIIFMGRWDENGAVLTPDYRPYEVAWFMGGMHAVIKTCKSFHSHNECLGVGHTDSEVIGNIFESPELLTTFSKKLP